VSTMREYKLRQRFPKYLLNAAGYSHAQYRRYLNYL